MSSLSLDEFRAKVREQRVSCKVCGELHFALSEHLREKHHLSAGQYRNKYPGAALESDLVKVLTRSFKKSPFLGDYSLESIFDEKPSVLEAWKKKLPKTSWSPELQGLIPKSVPFKFTANALPIAANLVLGRNLLVTGPTGCGKTAEILAVMSRMGVPVQRANMHGDVTYHTFIGSREVNQQGTFFKPGMLPRAMKGGYPVLLDEIDFTPASIGAVLFPVLEGERSLYIPELGETIKAEPGFAVFATGNTGGKGDVDGVYTGTEVLNSALLNRFSIKLSATYLSPDEEKEFLEEQFAGVRKEFITWTVRVASELRNAFLQGQIGVTWSHRNVQDFLTFSTLFKSAGQALDFTLMNWLGKDDEVLVRAILNKLGPRPSV